MDKQDDIIKLFEDFNPDVSDDGIFVGRVMRSMASVEMIKERYVMRSRQSRIAVVVATAVGVIIGLVSPVVVRILADVIMDVPIVNGTETYIPFAISCVLYAIVALGCSYVAYDISRALLLRHVKCQL